MRRYLADLYTLIRNWSGVSVCVQLLNRVGFDHFGWDWVNCLRSTKWWRSTLR